MSYALPFKRGEIWISTAQGGFPSAMLGKTYFDPRDGNEIMIVRNTDASAIAGCLGVKWETAGQWAVDKIVASGAVQACGIVDPAYANAGRTVPVNAGFTMVRRGRTYAIAGAVTTAGSPMVSDSAASNLVEGRFQNGVEPSAQITQVKGQFLASANAGGSVLCDVLFV
jgi:hypothetical protein